MFQCCHPVLRTFHSSKCRVVQWRGAFASMGWTKKPITEKGSVDALLRPCLRYTVTRRQDPPQKSYIRYVVELVRVNGYRRLEKYILRNSNFRTAKTATNNCKTVNSKLLSSSLCMNLRKISLLRYQHTDRDKIILPPAGIGE